MLRRRTLAVLAATAAGTAGIAAGAVAATGGGSEEGAADLASAINARAGTQITAEDVQGAFTDVLKEDLAEAVTAGRITQAQADEMLERARNGFPPGPGLHVHDGPRAEILAPVATALGLTEAQLRDKLDDGTTLAKIAEARGVSRADLLAAITAALKAAAPDLSNARAAEMAARIADRTGPPGLPGLHGRLSPRPPVLGPVAKALGLTRAELRQRLGAGDTLAEVAKAEGVSRGKLLAAITKALRAADPDLSRTRLNEMANHIADGPERGLRHHGGPPPPPIP